MRSQRIGTRAEGRPLNRHPRDDVRAAGNDLVAPDQLTFRITLAPQLELDRILRQGLVADGQADGAADEVGVFELDPRPLGAIVDQHVETRRFELPGQIAASFT